MELTKINKETVRDSVYKQLFNSIASGSLLPGQSLKLRELSKNLGVSIQPIREALWQLNSERIVVIDTNRGISVNSLSISEIHEAVQIQLNLDTKLAVKAAAIRPDSAVQSVQTIFEKMELAFKEQDIETYILNNAELHFSIYSYAEMPFAFTCVKQIWGRVAPYYYLAGSIRGIESYELQYHKEMLDGFKTRNKKKIKNAVCEDLRNWAKKITEVMTDSVKAKN